MGLSAQASTYALLSHSRDTRARGIDDLAAACTANLERLAQKDKENRVRAAPPRRTSTTAPPMPAKEPSPPPRPREPLDAALFAGPGDDDSDF